MRGQRFISRQGMGLMINAGLPDWVAESPEDYLVRACSLASDLPALAALRAGLREKVLASPVFDANSFAQHFQSALRGMWQRWCLDQGAAPAALPPITIPTPAPTKTLTLHQQAQLTTLFNEGRFDELEIQVSALLNDHPDNGFLWKGLGIALSVQGKDGLHALRNAALYSPQDAEAHSSLGNGLMRFGRLEEAVQSYRRAVEIKPDFAEAHSRMGKALMSLGGLDEVVANFRRVLKLLPDFAEAHSNLAVALGGLGRLDEAVTSCRRALEIKPDIAEAHNNLGLALWGLGRLEEAVASCRRALEIKPDFLDAHDNLLLCSNYLRDHPREQALADARRYGELVAAMASPHTRWPNTPDPLKPLRVGFVSGDLRKHPVAYFLQGLVQALANSAHGRIELLAYSNHYSSDAATAALKACFNHWRSALGMPDASLAEQIRHDGVDILIDLSGHTAHNRLPVFALKPAPVQLSWLGYFATTGVQAIDYFLADPLSLPAALEKDFTETVWRLPHSRLCFTPAPADHDAIVASLPALRNGWVTFGCFNNLSKMNDAVVALWVQVLKAVPNSRLFLKCAQLGQPSMCQRVSERFALLGIPASRLRLEGQSPRNQYLGAYADVDIALDPFPFTGGTTTAEGLWMGVPALTLAGERFISRQGLGLMINAGLPQWVADGPDDYVARASQFASDLPALATLRASLRDKVLASPVFDNAAFALNFEAALRGMWQRWCLDQGVEVQNPPALDLPSRVPSLTSRRAKLT
jgi:protein O-GlcNAc transferase